jgi:hypothetical protein
MVVIEATDPDVPAEEFFDLLNMTGLLFSIVGGSLCLFPLTWNDKLFVDEQLSQGIGIALFLVGLAASLAHWLIVRRVEYVRLKSGAS